MSETVTKIKIRIPVAVDAKGRWYAYSWNTGDSYGPTTLEELTECVGLEDLGPGEVMHWVVAEVPLPTSEEIEGRVE